MIMTRSIDPNTFTTASWHRESEGMEYERNHLSGLSGWVNNFKPYPLIWFDFMPFTFNTHQLDGWEMRFKQKTTKSRMYLHFYNKRGFGFRLRLPAKLYYDINDVFNSIPRNINPRSSESSVVNVRNGKEPMSFEEAAAAERQAILERIGDYRGEKVDLPDNVVDFLDYLKEPKPIKTTDEMVEDIARQIG